jgi:hypothetical protein
MNRRGFVNACVATTLSAALPARAQENRIRRNGRIRQGLWRTNFGADTSMSLDDMCREAARLGVYGFDLIAPEDWPVLRRHGLEPLLVGTGGVDFENGIIHPEVHGQVEASICARTTACEPLSR